MTFDLTTDAGRKARDLNLRIERLQEMADRHPAERAALNRQIDALAAEMMALVSKGRK